MAAGVALLSTLCLPMLTSTWNFSDHNQGLLALGALASTLAATAAISALAPAVLRPIRDGVSGNERTLLEHIKNTVTLSRRNPAPPPLPFEDQPIDFGAQILLADLREAQERIIAENTFGYTQGPAAPGGATIVPDVVYRDSFGVLDADVIVRDDDVIDSLELLYTASCDPGVHERLGAEEELRLWGPDADGRAGGIGGYGGT